MVGIPKTGYELSLEKEVAELKKINKALAEKEAGGTDESGEMYVTLWLKVTPGLYDFDKIQDVLQYCKRIYGIEDVRVESFHRPGGETMTGKEYDTLLQLAEDFKKREHRAVNTSVQAGDVNDGRGQAFEHCAKALREALRNMVQGK